jgi:hypothetical protein
MELANVYARELKRDADRYRTHVISAEQLLAAEEEAVAGLKGFLPAWARKRRSSSTSATRPKVFPRSSASSFAAATPASSS